MMVGRQFVEYKPPVIGEEQCGERKGNDEANHSQKAAPDGEAEKGETYKTIQRELGVTPRDIAKVSKKIRDTE